MRFNTVFLIALLAASLFCCKAPDRDEVVSRSRSAVRNTTEATIHGWDRLNAAIEKLDSGSSDDQLKEAKQQVNRYVQESKSKATNQYAEVKAAWDRLDAAEQLKKAKTQFDKLAATGKSLQDGTNSASKTLAEAQRRYDDAKIRYEKAKAAVKSTFAGSGMSLP